MSHKGFEHSAPDNADEVVPNNPTQDQIAAREKELEDTGEEVVMRSKDGWPITGSEVEAAIIKIKNERRANEVGPRRPTKGEIANRTQELEAAGTAFVPNSKGWPVTEEELRAIKEKEKKELEESRS